MEATFKFCGYGMTNSLFCKYKYDQLFLNLEKLVKLVVDTGREIQILGPW